MKNNMKQKKDRLCIDLVEDRVSIDISDRLQIDRKKTQSLGHKILFVRILQAATFYRLKCVRASVVIFSWRFAFLTC